MTVSDLYGSRRNSEKWANKKQEDRPRSESADLKVGAYNMMIKAWQMAPKSEQFRTAPSVLLGMGLTWLRVKGLKESGVFAARA